MTTAIAVRPAAQPTESPGQSRRFDQPPTPLSRAVAVRESGREEARRLWWRYAAQADESAKRERRR